MAQSYATILDELGDPKNYYCMEHWEYGAKDRAKYARFVGFPSFTNKLFVKPELMRHFIRITNVRVERLQAISDSDCIAEGIGSWECWGKRYYGFYDYTKDCMRRFNTPREAYAALIDRISGKGVWNSNPYVFVYDFELVKE